MKDLDRSRSLSRPAQIIGAALPIVFFALHIGLVALYMNISADIAYQNSLLPDIMTFCYQAAETLAFFIVYAWTVLVIFDAGWRGGLAALLVYGASSVLRHAVLVWLGFGELWAELLNLALELVQYLPIVLVTALSVRMFNAGYAVLCKGSARLGQEAPLRTSLVFPAKQGALSPDPIRRGAWCSAICVAVMRVGGRLIFDINYGWPQDVMDGLNMLFHYLWDLAIAALCGGLVLGAAAMLWQKKSKKQ